MTSAAREIGGAALAFRRQYILAPRPVSVAPGWLSRTIRPELVASWHPDLEVHSVTDADGAILTLFGFWVDSTRPELGSRDILVDVSAHGPTIGEIIRRTHPLAGRWALLVSGAQGTHILHDACGLRTVFYHKDRQGVVWCASQPELLRTQLDFAPLVDPDLDRLRSSPEFGLLEGATFGPATPYEGVLQLLANHRLDLKSGETTRFFPATAITPRDADAVVREAAAILQGAIAAMVHRGDTMMPVTAGWDSRVLLAASRQFSSAIRYYVHRAHRPPWDPDLRVPRRLMRRLGLPFRINPTRQRPPREFEDQLRQNVTSARVLSKTRNIYFHFRNSVGFTNLNGNGGEIGRQYFRAGPSSRSAEKDLSAEQLAAIVGFPGQPFVEKALAAWREQVRKSPEAASVPLLDLLYWEQRMSKWGAQFPAEQDIAVEEFSPFNNRHLLLLLLSAPAEWRQGPEYRLYRRIIEVLWPECMAVPVNPRGVVGRLADAARRALPADVKVRLKQMSGRG